MAQLHLLVERRRLVLVVVSGVLGLGHAQELRLLPSGSVAGRHLELFVASCPRDEAAASGADRALATALLRLAVLALPQLLLQHLELLLVLHARSRRSLARLDVGGLQAQHVLLAYGRQGPADGQTVPLEVVPVPLLDLLRQKS